MSVDDRYGEAKQALMDDFKEKFTKIANDALSKLYCDVSQYAPGDDFLNYRNVIRDEIRADFIKEIATENGHHSWANTMRMELLKHHPVQLRSKIITDLEDRVKWLEQHIEDSRRRW